jgi:hypothetical protein
MVLRNLLKCWASTTAARGRRSSQLLRFTILGEETDTSE